MHPSRLVLATVSVVLVLLAGPAVASAAPDRVVLTGGTFIAPGQTAGDVVVVDGTVRIAGHVTGDVVAVSGPARVTGRIDGDLIMISDRATLAPTARIGGDLRYGDEKPTIAPGARVAGDVSNENWADAANGWGWVSSFAWWVAVSISTLVLGLAMVWLAPGALRAADRAVREHLGTVAGMGVIVEVLAPIVGVGALVTLVGIPLGIAILLAAVPVLAIAYVSAIWFTGRRVLGARNPSPWLALLAGWAILRALALIPIVGGLVTFVATLLGLGSLVVALWNARRHQPVPAEPSPQHFPAAAA